MNKEKIFAFVDELNKLYEKHGLFIDSDAAWYNELPYISFKGENKEDEELYISFDAEKQKYILWDSKFTNEEGRVWFEVRKEDAE